jgi:hypothetical protein
VFPIVVRVQAVLKAKGRVSVEQHVLLKHTVHHDNIMLLHGIIFINSSTSWSVCTPSK